MNKQIQKLALQAGIQMFEDRAFGWSVIAGTDHNVQRFAELIVAECANQVDWILAEGGKTQGDLIKQHFEIDE